MQGDGGREQPEPFPALADGLPDQAGKAQLEDQRGEALPEAEQPRAGLRILQQVQLRLQRRAGLFRDIGEQHIPLPGIDQDGNRQITDHRQPEEEQHLRAAVSDAVRDGRMRRGRFLLHQEFHREEAAGLLEEAGGQPAVEGVPKPVVPDGGAVGTVQHHLVQDALQDQGEHEEGAGTDQDGRDLNVVLAHQIPRQTDRDGNADERIDRHQDD